MPKKQLKGAKGEKRGRNLASDGTNVRDLKRDSKG